MSRNVLAALLALSIGVTAYYLDRRLETGPACRCGLPTYQHANGHYVCVHCDAPACDRCGKPKGLSNPLGDYRRWWCDACEGFDGDVRVLAR